MKEASCASPVQVLMSMMSRDWLRSVRRTASCGRDMGFWICRGYEVAERGGGRVASRRAMSLDASAVLRCLPSIYTIYKSR